MQTANDAYTVVTKKSGDQYVSLCLEFCVVACGRTKKSALKNLQYAIDSYLDATEGSTLSPSRPVPVDVLHEFLRGEESPEPPTRPMKAEVMMLAHA